MWLFLTDSLLEPTSHHYLKAVAPQHNTGTYPDPPPPVDVQEGQQEKGSTDFGSVMGNTVSVSIFPKCFNLIEKVVLSTSKIAASHDTTAWVSRMSHTAPALELTSAAMS